MLKGWTAFEWARPLRPTTHVMLSLTVVCLIGYFAVGGTAEAVTWWLSILIGLLVASFVLTLVFYFTAMVKAIRESRAGYTTTAGMYPELPQLDRDGRVIRAAGHVGSRRLR
ncbi:hypothetical protein ASF30_09985 [Leifsonia sp. Leaf264]|nr:hypothetical protein ASF30_09985 [Leifsonia sp. Leaf264]